MNYLLLIIAALGWLFAFYLWRLMEAGQPKKWITKYPREGTNRGPNADSSYHTVRLDGHGHWFTAEDVARANERAIKNGDA